MSGVFAEWQPIYAAHGIATFPVSIIGKDKRPAVKGYLKLGSQVSDQLAIKFPKHDALGLACKRNNITVLDVDTPDERVLQDGLSKHGPTPFIVRSGSGNFQAWYRHDGEGRRVRPDPGVPVDILGDGYVVAPPSMGSKGAYQIIQGTLDDLDHLPRMLKAPAPNNDNPQPQRSTLPSALTREGNRNDSLWRQCMKMARGSTSIQELMERAMRHNETEFYDPLPAEEILKIVASAWDYEVRGENWYGHGARVVVEHKIIDDLASSDPVAFALLNILRRHHWGRDFALAKVFADSLGWTLRSFKEARGVLVDRKLIECIHPGGRGPSDPPMYRFPKGSENAPQ